MALALATFFPGKNFPLYGVLQKYYNSAVGAHSSNDGHNNYGRSGYPERYVAYLTSIMSA